MCLAQGPQRSDAGEAQTRSLLVSSQALYHWATAFPTSNMLIVSKWLTLKASRKNVTEMLSA